MLPELALVLALVLDPALALVLDLDLALALALALVLDLALALALVLNLDLVLALPLDPSPLGAFDLGGGLRSSVVLMSCLSPCLSGHCCLALCVVCLKLMSG